MADSRAQIVISAKDETFQAFNSIRGSLASLNSAAGALGVALSAGALTGFLKDAIDTADSLKDLSKSTGIAVEQLAGLSLASKQSGGDLESIANSVNKLSVNMGKDGEKFAQLGITAKDPLEAFKQLADVYNAIEDPQKRAAFAAEALGKGWAGAVPLLAEGGKRIGEMVQKGTDLSGVTQKLAEDSDKFNDTIAELKTSFSGFFSREVSQALPILQSLADWLKQSGQAAKDSSSDYSMLRTTLEVIAILGANVAYVFKEFGNEIGGIGAQLNALVHGDLQGFNAISKVMKADGERARKELDAFEQSILNPKGHPVSADDAYGISGRSKRGAPSDKALKDFIGGGTKDNTAQKELAATQEYMKSVAELGDKIFALNDIEKSNTEKLQEKLDAMVRLPPVMREAMQASLDMARAVEQENDAHKVMVDTIDREIESLSQIYDAEQQLNAQMASAASGWSEKLLKENQDLNVDLIKNDKERAKQQLEIEHQRILEQIGAELAGNEKLAEAMDQENKNYDLRLKKLDETKSMAHDLGLTFTSAFEDAVTGGKKFSTVLQSLAQDIEKIMIRRTVTEPLMKGMDTLLSGAGDWLGSIFKNADGGVYSGAGIGAYSGSIVSRPTLFPFAKGVGLMGESGTEAILPLKRGEDGKLGIQGGGGGSVNLQVNINEAPGTQASVTQSKGPDGSMSLDIIIEKVEAGMSRRMARGDGLSPTIERIYGVNRVAGAFR